ncbi:putative superfamily III holin-X [Litoreibacter ponti]|uniref:Putative superfamily III holin-X n=1 Tax=Litoreibacter ponti TaxID=1510457 RepID=A0A2T6BLY1_9RHOB|nr:phage holin family protein [Litoreibacter ponti]PTX57069.1 putative superfamily III holin-X [Litoreibacter ponti]
MVEHLKKKAARASKKAGLLTGGLLAVITGIAFLSWAAWFYLSLLTDPMTASVIIGAAYVGIGLVMIGMAVMSSGDSRDHLAEHDEQVKAAQPSSDNPPLMQAFMFGMEAGLSAHRR